MISNKVGFKNFYSLFTIAGILLLSTAFLVPQKASAQAAVPVRDAELIKLFLQSIGGGGTYIDPVTKNPVEIVATECATTTLPGYATTTKVNGVDKTFWVSGKENYFNLISSLPENW